MAQTPYPATGWRSPLMMLMIMQAGMQFSFAAWWVLIKNFAVDEVGFTGWEIGIQETIREIPGFLAFLAVYLILFMTERTLALLSLVFLGVGVAITGVFDTTFGLLATTFIMSIGFHYYETCNQSLSLQWLPKNKAAHQMGQIVAAGAFAQLVAYGIIFVVWQTFQLSFALVFALTGSITLIAVLLIILFFPPIETKVVQRRHLVLRKRYWLYYLLTFMSGARRQIFVVFAALMMVEKFDFDVHHMASLFLINGVINMVLAPQIGRLIGYIGERHALTLEYIGLIGVFVAYAFVSDAFWASVLYVIDHVFFAMAIAMRTYFQKIADPADIAPTAGVAFTINHIASVFTPILFGLLWLYSPPAVFLSGAAMAFISLILALMVPRDPQEGNEVDSFWDRPSSARQAPGPAE
ncbi:MAG: MFS transporter [Pseudomonadota bacterium]